MSIALFVILLAAALTFFARTMWLFGRAVATGAPDPRPRLDQLPARLHSVGLYFFAQKKVAELKALGIDEYFIVQDEGKMQWAVSLGVFSTEDAARSRLETLRAKGVKTAQTGERETRVTKIWFQVRNPEAVLQAKLRDLAQGFPGTDLRDCP